jgi:propionate CoA-transferase
MSKVITAEKAASLIKDGATLGASAITLAGWPEEIAIAIEKRFLETGKPEGLMVVHASGIGDWKTRGMQHFAHEGLVRRWMGGHTGLAPDFARMILESELEAYCLPQGTVAQLWREIASKRPGVITKTGLHTFIDPRVEGGKLNSVTKEDYVKVIELDGQEWMFYPTFPVDVAIIRGSVGDERGNLTMNLEGGFAECLPLAQAAKNSGGIVIAQVEYLAQGETLPPRHVRVPGVLVDYVVVAKPENHWQSAATYFNPAFAGTVRVPVEALRYLPVNERLFMARRAAMELRLNIVVNLGIGVPDGIPIVAGHEGVADMMTLTTEFGAIGGIPAGGHDFGMVTNAEANVEHQVQFDWYDGGGIDVAFLSAAEVDREGNVNVSRFGPKLEGPGGFINIAQHAKKLVYCGAMMAGGLKVAGKDGKLVILQEGKKRKFVNKVEQITFSGKYAAMVKQPVLFVTDRAVFKLQDGGLMLIEIAPGVDLEKNVLAMMDFAPKISPNLKLMPGEIFNPTWGKLKQHIESVTEKDVKPEPLVA